MNPITSDCSICWNPFVEQPPESGIAIRHGNGSDPHFFHRACLIKWIARKPLKMNGESTCPYCSGEIKIRSLVSKKKWKSLPIPNPIYHAMVGAALPFVTGAVAMASVEIGTSDLATRFPEGQIVAMTGGMIGGATAAFLGKEGIFRETAVSGAAVFGASVLIGDSFDELSLSARLVKIVFLGVGAGMLAGAGMLFADKKILIAMRWPPSDRAVFLVSQIAAVCLYLGACCCVNSRSADFSESNPLILTAIAVAGTMAGVLSTRT